MLAPFNDIVVRSIVVVGELEGEDQVEDERASKRASERKLLARELQTAGF